MAPFFYTKLWVLDPKTLQVVDAEERLDFQKIYDPMWTANDIARNFTPEQLADQAEEFVERASSRALREEAVGVVALVRLRPQGRGRSEGRTGLPQESLTFPIQAPP